MNKKWKSFDTLVDHKGLRKWQRHATKHGLRSRQCSFYTPLTNGKGAVIGVVAFKRIAQAEKQPAD